MNKAKIGDKVSSELIANGGLQSSIGIHSLWTTECYDAQGNLKWVEKDRPNVCTTEGINFMLDVMFHNTAAKTVWYVALFDRAAYTPAITDTYHLWADAGGNNCSEVTAYTSATRVAYVEAAASSKVTTNTASKASFTMNDTKTIQGAALVSLNTKSDHTAGDYLFSVSKFAVARDVIDTDVLRVTISITGADI